MAKRTAEDAELDVVKDEELPASAEAENESEIEEGEGVNNGNDEGRSGSEESDSDASSTPDGEGLRALALSWLEDKRIDGAQPNAILEGLGVKVSLENMPVSEQWGLLEKFVTSDAISMAIFRTLFYTHRQKLPNINTFEDVLELVKKCNNIVILTGAGVSVSCGIPDFRSPGGLYSIIEEKYNLPEPQCLFDIHYLRDDPHPFFEFAREIYPGKHKPSPTHLFIKELAQRGKLLRNYTQNIDTLEMVAGVAADKLVNCHGSFATASCVVCKHQVPGDEIRDDIMNSVIPQCKVCDGDGAFMKPDIVFFGESLPDRFDECLKEDTDKADLLLVMGSSLKVKPVAFVPEVIKSNVPQLLVNRELVGQPHEFDYAYLGDCDSFCLEVCRQLGWTLDGRPPSEYSSPPFISSSPSPVSSSSSVPSLPTSLTSLPSLPASSFLTSPSPLTPLTSSTGLPPLATPTLSPLPSLPPISLPSFSVPSSDPPTLSLLSNPGL